MLNIGDAAVQKLLLCGGFGLEKESLRVTADGHMARTPHPFSADAHIARDFCENQTEINTPVLPTAQAAVDALAEYDRKIQRTLAALPQPEYLWPFSNPPYLRAEDDIPVARFVGADARKTDYREYLARRYGRYKMTLSGVHINYSFGEALLRAAHAAAGGQGRFADYKNRLYVEVAEKAAAYGWLLTAVTAASPLTDLSFWQAGQKDADVFCGMASVRCSELGYWNFFAPVLDYTGLAAYTGSIRRYLAQGLLRCPTELYYPVRLKPAGAYGLDALDEGGVDHIELRMADLDPLAPAGADVRDVAFAQLFLVWLAALPPLPLDAERQVQAVQNFKNAAHYDLKTVRLVLPSGASVPAQDAALAVLDEMRRFYAALPHTGADAVLAFERAKFENDENRYAQIVRRRFSGTFVQKGLALARENQRRACALRTPESGA